MHKWAHSISQPFQWEQDDIFNFLFTCTEEAGSHSVCTQAALWCGFFTLHRVQTTTIKKSYRSPFPKAKCAHWEVPFLPWKIMKQPARAYCHGHVNFVNVPLSGISFTPFCNICVNTLFQRCAFSLEIPFFTSELLRPYFMYSYCVLYTVHELLLYRNVSSHFSSSSFSYWPSWRKFGKFCTRGIRKNCVCTIDSSFQLFTCSILNLMCKQNFCRNGKMYIHWYCIHNVQRRGFPGLSMRLMHIVGYSSPTVSNCVHTWPCLPQLWKNSDVTL